MKEELVKKAYDIALERYAAAVSYTHLDVYKRQGTPRYPKRKRFIFE